MIATSAGEYIPVLIAVITFIAAIAAAIVLARSGILKTTVDVDATAFSRAQTLMQTQDHEIQHLKEQRIEDSKLISTLEGKVSVLENIVTARDLITELDRTVVRGFEHLNVPASVLKPTGLELPQGERRRNA